MKKGFTLIEVIATTAIISLLLPIVFTIFFTIIKTQIEVSALARIKNEGDRVRNTVLNTIRNEAVEITTNCSSISGFSGSVCFTNSLLNYIGFEVTNNNIVMYKTSGSGTTQTTLLQSSPTSELPITAFKNGTNDMVTIVGTASDKIVLVQYKVQYNPQTVAVSSQEITYRFYIKLRH